MKRSDIAFVAAVNDRAVLESCLLRSPDLASGDYELHISENFPSAASALNDGLDQSAAEYVVFVHQDVYLPRGWAARVGAQLDQLANAGEQWAIIGTIGMRPNGDFAGCAWSTDVLEQYGTPGLGPSEVVALDECVLILRRSSGLRFDPELPHFHLYAADMILQAKLKGYKSFAVDAPVVHHSMPVHSLRGGYEQAYRYMQRKWRENLPWPTLIIPVTRGSYALWRNEIRRIRRRLVRKLFGKDQPYRLHTDPQEIAKQAGYE